MMSFNNTNNNNKRSKFDYGMEYTGDSAPQPQDEFVSQLWATTAAMTSVDRGLSKPIGHAVVHTMLDGSRVFVPAKENQEPNTAEDASQPKTGKETDDLMKELLMKDLLASTGVNLESIDVQETAVEAPVECRHCAMTPCYLLHVNEDLDAERNLYEHLMFVGEEMSEAECYTSKEIRHSLYKVATTFIHGRLPKGDRRKLPPCVEGDIRDAYPEKGGNYTNFKEVSWISKDI